MAARARRKRKISVLAPQKIAFSDVGGALPANRYAVDVAAGPHTTSKRSSVVCSPTMSRSLHRFIGTVSDLAGILVALASAGLLLPSTQSSGASSLLAHAGVASIYVVVWLIVASRIGVYNVPPGRNLAVAVRRTLEAWAATWGVAGVLLLSILSTSPASVWLLLAAGAMTLTLLRLTLAVTPWGRTAGRARAIVIGSCPSAEAL